MYEIWQQNAEQRSDVTDDDGGADTSWDAAMLLQLHTEEPVKLLTQAARRVRPGRYMHLNSTVSRGRLAGLAQASLKLPEVIQVHVAVIVEVGRG